MLSTLKGKKRTRTTLTNYFAKKSKIQMKTPTLKIVINQIHIVKRLVVAVRKNLSSKDEPRKCRHHLLPGQQC